MIKVIAAAVFLAILVEPGTSAQAKVVHVSPQALAGIAEDEQVRTISDAARRVVAGDRVVIHGGT